MADLFGRLKVPLSALVVGVVYLLAGCKKDAVELRRPPTYNFWIKCRHSMMGGVYLELKIDRFTEKTWLIKMRIREDGDPGDSEVGDAVISVSDLESIWSKVESLNLDSLSEIEPIPGPDGVSYSFSIYGANHEMHTLLFRQNRLKYREQLELKNLIFTYAMKLTKNQKVIDLMERL